jgi:hypothetical protein
MRIALIPMDSRPVNWLMPKRLADIAGVELSLPPREFLGTLARPADSTGLQSWLRESVIEAAHPPQALVVAWDALLYGGLVQSRAAGEAELAPWLNLLAQVNWERTAGYGFITVPRLGMTVASADDWHTHQKLRQYLMLMHRPELSARDQQRLQELESELGSKVITNAHHLRQRNHSSARQVLEFSLAQRLRQLHIAAEDNGEHGPHLSEMNQLRERYLELKSAGPGTECTFFDGADEAGLLLLARAIKDQKKLSQLRVELALHPSSPGPDRYRGLYESRTLGDGLTFLAKLLDFRYVREDGAIAWLVNYGVQPQPDAFTQKPAELFANPYLLPKQVPAGLKVAVADLCACNGGNPRLVEHLLRHESFSTWSYSGYNTNFNTLGISAATIRLADGNRDAAQRFLLERLADDVVYQSIARPRVIDYLVAQKLDPLDFRAAHPLQVTECRRIVEHCWHEWTEGSGAPVLAAQGIAPKLAATLRFRFPWLRAFEIEATVGS